MKPITLLIFGGSGQIGWHLQQTCRCLGTILAPTRKELDLAQFDAVRHYIKTHRPDIVINAAAYTAVDDAETKTQSAKLLNAELPALLAEETKQLGSWLIHYSTDYVFNGNGSTPYQEIDPTGPLSHYGRTKLRGEKAIVEQCDRWMIFRTQWVYSTRTKNFVQTIAHKATESNVLKVVDDQYGVPTSAALIAQATATILARLDRAHDLSKAGIYHLTAEGETTWCGVAQEIVSFLRATQGAETIATIEPTDTAHYPTAAKRPLNGRLSTDKVKTTFQLRLPDWKTELHAFLASHHSGGQQHAA
jgi:dTDP-4-dehydrorhamnose reductase